jgi:hypothetical protein
MVRSTRSRLRQLFLAGLCLHCSEASAPLSPPPAAGGGGSIAGSAGTPSGGAAGSQASGGTGASFGGSSAGSGLAGASSGAAGAIAGSAGTSSSDGDAGAGGEAPEQPAPGATRLGESKLTGAGLSLVSYGGYLNGESFQQDGILTHKGYQYAAFWNTARHVVLARRALPSGAWQSIELSDYTNAEDDAHNTISLGVTAADGTLHLAFDHHVSPLHYRKSVAGLLSDPANATWSTASFGAVGSNLAGVTVKDFTYPRFVSEPGGEKMLLSARVGTSGSGDEYLWEYSAATHAWTSLGKYIDGLVDNINAYLHGLSYGPGGQRLHAAWCWRDTSNASTNHDLLYAYSDDHGRTWHNDEGVAIASSGSQAINSKSAGLVVRAIGQNRGLINQEHLVVDAEGRVHVLLSHLPDASADDANFDSARGQSRYFHYVREAAGKWTRSALDQPAVAAFRGKLALSSSGNLYAVLPDLRIAGSNASAPAWQLLQPGQPGRYFSDPLVDATRLLTENVLSVVYPTKASGDIFVVDYSVQ